VPPATVANASTTASGREELKALNFQTGQQMLSGDRYDLPTVIDVALRSNPKPSEPGMGRRRPLRNTASRDPKTTPRSLAKHWAVT
jgi:hypothetical protein